MNPTRLITLACLLSCAVFAADPAPVPLVAQAPLPHPSDGQIFYFLLTDRFSNGDPSNDKGGLGGDVMSHGFDVSDSRRYHGGDLKGLITKLDYIQALGVTTLWITPPFKNQAVQNTSSGYHGYWILDFTNVDPHLGSNDDLKTLVNEVHRRGMKLFLDIVVNHTADVIQFADGDYRYVPVETAPYRTSPPSVKAASKQGSGNDARDQISAFAASASTVTLQSFTYNGVPKYFKTPRFNTAFSFPHVPVNPPGKEHAKAPEWLNDPIRYHNRGDSTFKGESSTLGDFGGLDDLFTEQQEVVDGFVDIFRFWIKEYQIDGYRIDTVRHVNKEFWQAFCPEIKRTAAEEKRTGFFQFGEYAMNDSLTLGDFLWAADMDSVLDFPFYNRVRDWVSKGADKAVLETLFLDDDLLLRHNGDARGQTTFIGNHDDGRFGGFVAHDNPGASDDVLKRLDLLGHGLLLLSRGVPILYYGEEQGMQGFGNDVMAREDMFASQATDYRNLPLIGSKRTGADDKFDTANGLFTTLEKLVQLRRASPALSRGATWVRATRNPRLLAFSRMERREQRETLAVFNNSRTESLSTTLTIPHAGSAAWNPLYSSAEGILLKVAASNADKVEVTLPPLAFAVWQSNAPYPVANSPLRITLRGPAANTETLFTERTVDGQTYPVRQELSAEVTGADGFVEVTFALERRSRPGQFEILGTDDSAPYRVFWRPPADLRPMETFRLIATVNDLRGRAVSASIENLHIGDSHPAFGVFGTVSPHFSTKTAEAVDVRKGEGFTLASEAEGTAPIVYQWFHDGYAIDGADTAVLTIAAAASGDAGLYTVTASNRSGTTRSHAMRVTVK